MSRTPKKRHPADVRDDARIALAVSYTVFFRKSPSEKYWESAATLADARAVAARMTAEHGKFGRRAGVYAVMPDRSSIFVPDSYAPH